MVPDFARVGVSRAVPIRGPDGETVEWFGAAKATDAAQFGTYTADFESGMVDFSPVVGTILGVDWSSASPRVGVVPDFVHPDDRMRVQEKLDQSMDPQGSGEFVDEHRVVLPDGSVRWVLMKGTTEFEGEGAERHAVAMRGVLLDVTDRKDSERSLRESEQRFRTLANNAPVIIWLADGNGLTFANRAYQDFVGKEEAAILGTQWTAYLHPDDIGPFVLSFNSAVEKRARFESTYRQRRHDGEYRWHHALANPRILGDTFAGYVGVSVDVHEMTMADTALREADRSKDHFIAMLAHELRNPLAAMTGAFEVLASSESPASTEQAKDILERQLVAMRRIVDDLLEVSRITRAKLTLNREHLDLNDVLRHVTESFRPISAQRNQSLQIVLPQTPVHVDGDLVRLGQVFTNLLTNASKYTPERGNIWVVATVLSPTSEGGARCEVIVRDDGIGMEAELLPRVFGLFVQGEGSPDSASEGLGIGLTLVREIVNQHGGSVSAGSLGSNQGSTFTVTLPVVGRPTENAKPAIIVAKGSPRRVLIVEDNADWAKVLTRIIEREGHEVRWEPSSLQAVDTIKQFKPHVALIDIGLPRINGLDLARLIRTEIGPEIRLIAVTGYGSADIRQQSKEAGFNKHLLKPVDFTELRQLLVE